MEITKLTPSHKEKLELLIRDIEAALADEAFWLPIKEEARAHFFDEEWTEFYGVFDGERLVGAAALFYNEYEYGESLRQLNVKGHTVAEIGRAMVHPDYRGNNLLYRINLHLITIAKAKGVDLLLSTIHPDNIPSQKSFQKLGMKKQHTYVKSDGFIRDIFTMPI